MRYYLQTPTNKGKAAFLLWKFRGKRLTEPPKELPTTDHAVVCVIDNGPFEAAGVAYSQKELDYFSRDRSMRPKEWLLLNDRTAVFIEAGLPVDTTSGNIEHDEEYNAWLARALKGKPADFVKCPQKHCTESAGHENPCAWYNY